ncbi:MAG: hypothetical protein VX728_04590, partial [Actinomycetota bacterium]|nr:hypothetical protein [Actinomycetota bacterium]
MTVSRGTRTVTRSWEVTPHLLSVLSTPRHDLVVEERSPSGDNRNHTFVLVDGPFSHWERHVSIDN